MLRSSCKLLGMISILGVFVQGAIATTLTTSDGNSGRSELNVALGMAAPVLAGDVGWGVSAWGGVEVNPGVPFYVGLDLGVYRWSQGTRQRDPLNALARPASDVTATSVQLLPTFYYQFLLPMLPAAVPYLGLSVGPNLYFAQGKTVEHGVEKEISALNIYAAVLFRPGIHVITSEQSGITLEPKLGILKSQVIFVPQVSVLWAL